MHKTIKISIIVLSIIGLAGLYFIFGTDLLKKDAEDYISEDMSVAEKELVMAFGSALSYGPFPGRMATNTGIAYNVAGSRSATTTTGVAFEQYDIGTSSYPWHINGASEATYTFYWTAASTSAEGAGEIHYHVLGSNNIGCHSATTSTSSKIPLKIEVPWYDAGPFLKNQDQSTTLSAATTSFIGSAGTIGVGRSVTFENLPFQCLKLEISGTSSALYVELITGN